MNSIKKPMKTTFASSQKRGFSLLELLVAMTVTTLIVGSLISITSIAMDTWNRSRSELRASRQAKAMVDTLARDLESLVTRRDNTLSEWLSAEAKSSGTNTSAVNLYFYTAAADRYSGNIGGSSGNEGDVSCVGYQLEERDPFRDGGSGAFDTFVLGRHLVNPDVTFTSLLGKPENDSDPGLNVLFQNQFGSEMTKTDAFVCENIFQFSITFNVQTIVSGANVNQFVTIGPASSSDKNLRITGQGITTKSAGAPDPTVPLTNGKITSIGISLSVLSDPGVEQLRRDRSKASDAKWLAKNSYQYSKLVQLPGQ